MQPEKRSPNRRRRALDKCLKNPLMEEMHVLCEQTLVSLTKRTLPKWRGSEHRKGVWDAGDSRTTCPLTLAGPSWRLPTREVPASPPPASSVPTMRPWAPGWGQRQSPRGLLSDSASGRKSTAFRLKSIHSEGVLTSASAQSPSVQFQDAQVTPVNTNLQQPWTQLPKPKMPQKGEKTTLAIPGTWAQAPAVPQANWGPCHSSQRGGLETHSCCPPAFFKGKVLTPQTASRHMNKMLVTHSRGRHTPLTETAIWECQVCPSELRILQVSIVFPAWNW